MAQIDRTGQPRSEQDLKDALLQVEGSILNILKVPPNLAVYLTITREALMELIERRKYDR